MSLIRPSILAPCLILVAAGAAQAQVGSGWNSYSPSRIVQIAKSGNIKAFSYSDTSSDNGGGHYRRANGIETFTLTDHTSNRCEVRVQNDYTSGQRQFQGEVRVSKPSTDQIVHQVFGNANASDGSGPAMFIKEFQSSGGTLKRYGGGKTLVTGIGTSWVRVNTLHNTSSNSIDIYINGSKKDTTGGGGKANHYTKYGCYGTLGASSAKIEWRNIHFYRK